MSPCFIFLDGKNGCFLVRDSKHGGSNCPYTLSVLNDDRVYNINIRVVSEGNFALGKQKQDENVSYQNPTILIHLLEIA